MNLSHHFLIAMPEMSDPAFAGTVTYILQHDEEGAMGVIINRALKLDLSEVFDSADLSANAASPNADKTVYYGGPVSSEQGFILHRPTERQWLSTLTNNSLNITTSKDILDALAMGEGPENFLFCLGYAGWTKGQLEEELKSNAWLTVPADTDVVFASDNDAKYKQALGLLGIDLGHLSAHGGLA